MTGLDERVRRAVVRADRFQRGRTWVAVPVAVVKKFGDDRGGRWAALVAYYGFLSIFPLLLAFTTVLSLVVQGDADLQSRILGSALAQFPIVGVEIQENLGHLEGSWMALVIGLALAIWGGMGVVLALGDALDDVWGVPRRERPGFLRGRLRALAALALLGALTVGSGVLAGVGAAAGSGGRWLSILATFAFDLVALAAAFRYLTTAGVRWRQVLPGAATAAVAWIALLSLGTWLVDRHLRNASDLYGFFGIVLGLLWWMFLGAQLLLLSAELNVVLTRRLWPRDLVAADEPASNPPHPRSDGRVSTS
jgi:YihY family inner membrane protein